MIKIPLALLLCSSLYLGCGSNPSPSQGRSLGQKDAAAKDNADHSGSQAPGDDLDEKAVPPQAVTGASLTCGKPHVLDAALNIDCLVKSAAGDRLKASDLGSRVEYGVDSTQKDDDVLISVLKAEPEEAFDVRYAVKAKDVSKIDRIIDSSTFFVKVFDEDDREIKGAVKSFLGIDLDIPSKEELKKAFFDKVDDLFGAIGL